MKKSIFTAIAVGALILGVGSFATADTIDVTGTIRDFQSSHPDFQAELGVDPGIVQTTLGADGKPVYAGQAGNPTTHGQVAFDQWYRDTPGINITSSHTITLDNGLGAGVSGGVYTYSNSNFFPLDSVAGRDWEGQSHNYWFTYEIHRDFTYLGGEFFNFTGDDDVWVFVNDELVIDLGGVHGAMGGSVDLDTLGLTLGQDYSFDFFFAERHTSESNFRIDTSIVVNNEVPEPATMILFGTGIAGLAGFRRRKRNN